MRPLGQTQIYLASMRRAIESIYTKKTKKGKSFTRLNTILFLWVNFYLDSGCTKTEYWSQTVIFGAIIILPGVPHLSSGIGSRRCDSIKSSSQASRQHPPFKVIMMLVKSAEHEALVAQAG